MEPTLPPLGDRFLSIHSSVPPDFESLHEGFQEFQVDDVIFNDKNVDRGNGPIE